MERSVSVEKVVAWASLGITLAGLAYNAGILSTRVEAAELRLNKNDEIDNASIIDRRNMAIRLERIETKEDLILEELKAPHERKPDGVS